MQEVAELKKMVYDLQAEISVIKIVLPNWFSLGDIAKEIGKSRDTIRKYLKANFEPDVDFKKDGGKLYISRDALFLVRKHYEK
jgi:predicted transcriptional regulator